MHAYLLPHLLERAADADPEAVAVIDGEASRSFAAIAQDSARLARVLRGLGVRRGDRVGVHLDKSIEAVTALYAVMSAGAAYVPLDPDAPGARLATIARDAALSAVITAAAKPAWPEIAAVRSDLPVVLLDVDETSSAGRPTAGRADVVREDSTPLNLGTLDQDLAYILYTSGSTGNPKGVMHTHRSALAFVDWAAEEFGVGADDVLSSHAPFHFDLSVFDLYAAARGRAAVTLVPRTLSMFPSRLARFIETNGVTVWYSVPTVLSMLATRGGLEPGALPSLRTILFAGEVFPTKFLRTLMDKLPGVRFANLYGPTETNVCTWYEVPELDRDRTEPVPIGRAVANDELYVVADDGTLAAHGDVGELWVRGGTVMRGYWGDDDRTQRTLIPDPFRRELGDPVYRTGDLVRWDHAGDLIFLGRRDAQIKSRGYRIELGDVEAAIYAHPAVRECAVLAVPDELITNRLEAFVVADGLDHTELAHFCLERLPKYMVPDRITFRDALPRTSTQKVDRQSLLAVDQSQR